MAKPSIGGGLGYTLTRAAQVWRTEVAVALAAHALTVPQFLVLMDVYRRERHGWDPPTQSQVGIRLGMDANTTSQVVRGLTSRGIVTREPHPSDRRARILRLTAAGLSVSREASILARRVNDLFFGVIPDEERAHLTALLEIITTASEQRS